MSEYPPLTGEDWAVAKGEARREELAAEIGLRFAGCSVVEKLTKPFLREKRGRWWYNCSLWPGELGSVRSLAELALPLAVVKWPTPTGVREWSKARRQIVAAIPAPGQPLLTPGQKHTLTRMVRVLCSMSVGTELERDDVALADRVLLIEDQAVALDLHVALPRSRARSHAAFGALEDQVLQRVLRPASSPNSTWTASADTTVQPDHAKAEADTAIDVRWAT